jgi:hypothetical protein
VDDALAKRCQSLDRVAIDIRGQALDQPTYSGVVDQRSVSPDDIETLCQIPVELAVKRRMVEIL